MTKPFLLFVLVLFLPQWAFAAPPAEPRQIVSLNEGWRFQFGDAPETVKTAAFDDSTWERVSVPHTWNRVGEYALTRGPATNNKQGIGWYRLSYDAKPMAKGRRLYIDFAAVGNIADVWINGAHVGQHKGAFTRFRFDVTPQWKPGAKNLIVVRADNSKPAVGSSTEHVIPLAGDFFIHGGLYRGVQLIEANDVGIDLLDFGGPGVYVDPYRVEYESRFISGGVDVTEILDDVALIAVKSKIRNSSATNRRLSVDVTIFRPSSNCSVCELKYKSKSVYVKARAVVPFGEIYREEGPVLWEGTKKAALYKVRFELRDGKEILDSVTQDFGIRTFKFDPKEGLTLNPVPDGITPKPKLLKLRGVSRHQDKMGKGWALTRDDHAEDMALMKEMGVNSVRHAHYPHADEWVEEADKAGMIVWAEVPYVTTPSFTGGEGSPELFANAEQQTRELIRQNYNHPSIMMWSVGNEVDAATLFGVSKQPIKPLKLLQHIAKIAQEEDPSRPIIFADCCEDVSQLAHGTPGVTDGEALAGTADMIGYNRYYGWYYPEPLKAAEQLASQMDKLHAKHPNLPISISEYGAGGAITQHSDNVLTGYVNATGRPQPEEYESWAHEQSWPVIAKRDYIWGSYVWNMFDFASDLRNEGDAVDINTKGLVSFDRKVKKDAFYYYKAQWNPEPMIHLTGKRYANRAYSVMDVKAYANTERASLSINGKFIGEVKCPDRICIWSDVALKPGPNTALATGYVSSERQGESEVPLGVNIWDEAIFTGPDLDKGIRINAGDIAASSIGGGLFGSDNFVTGGTPMVLNRGGFGGRGDPKKIVVAPNPALYDYWREGEAFSYAIPVPDGKWIVTVHSFAPNAETSGALSILSHGKTVLPALDVQKAAGGPLTGISFNFPVMVTDGVLKLDFSGVGGGKAVAAAIEINR